MRNLQKIKNESILLFFFTILRASIHLTNDFSQTFYKKKRIVIIMTSELMHILQAIFLSKEIGIISCGVYN